MNTSQINTFGLHVLCIDDSRSQLMAYKSQIEGMYKVTCAETYEEAVACLSAIRPDLILLDMTMPQVSGLEFLDILRFTPNYANIPVIIVSGDNDPVHVKEAFSRGAADYVRKPYDEEELLLRINRIFQLIGTCVKSSRDTNRTMNAAQDLLIESLADLASAKDNENTHHLARIGLYAEEIAMAASKTNRFRTEVSDEFVRKIAGMAKLHDLGKVNIPEYVLHKTGSLTEREFEFVKKHTSDGARTLDMIRLSFPDYAFLDFAHDIILFHHERWDGKGYPEGRSGIGIPLSARITAITDVFDAITTRRCYSESVGFEEACEVILSGRGTLFDPELVDTFKYCRARFSEIHAKYKDL